MLVELYRKKFPSSQLTDSQLNEDIAWLLKNLTAEQIFFSINYCSKYYHSETEENFCETVNTNRWEILKYYDIAKVKQVTQEVAKEEAEYDQRNTNKGVNKQGWFRKSIDFNLFE
jgi:hypothetical protein